MIIDRIENLKKYVGILPEIKAVSDFLEGHDLSNSKQGRVNINYTDLYLNIDEYNTKEQTSTNPEAHRVYADIQILVSGEEKIGYSDIKNCKTVIEYNTERDIEFLSGDCDYIKIQPGMFALFMPNDVHHPCIKINESVKVKKAVFKIKI